MTEAATALDVYETSPTVAQALGEIESAAGGRAALVEALSALPPNDKLTYVLGLLADPRHDARSLGSLCKAGGVGVGELIEAFKRGVHAKALIRAAVSIATHTPAVVEDVMVRAQPHLVDCHTCHGSLLMLHPDDATAHKIPCTRCVDLNGIPTGKIVQQPDLDRQKLALDLANLLPKKGPSVVVDQRKSALFMQDASPGGLTKLTEAMDRILYPRTAAAEEVLDGDVSTPTEIAPGEPGDLDTHAVPDYTPLDDGGTSG
jgi:hypothetical protein